MTSNDDGWINFPYVDVTVPCIHDYAAHRKRVALHVGGGAEDLTCTWKSSGRIRVEKISPCVAFLPELCEMSAFPIRGKRRLEQARKRNNQVWGETGKSDV